MRCPSCHKRLNVAGDKVGTKVKCPGCAVTFIAGTIAALRRGSLEQ